MSSPRRPVFDTTKRAFDVCASGLALIGLAPVLGVTALCVAAKLGRPVLFRQQRPGRSGEIFELVKFRTMLDVDEAGGIVTDEQRMTPTGSMLRALSVDELPSLVNIFRGDMSFVGPRPLLVQYLPLYSAEQGRRHDVRPGLTGLAQVNGRNALDWKRRFELDIEYVDNRSWMLDLQILFKTVDKVLRRDGISSTGHSAGAPFTGEV
ncbi:sugar transferase [Nesterenkonia sp. DZ6]|uniref:sugar transferase n=1 Tax=Nesterenkonia sp. DZ6 TaxID=2901229 RepID=UPI001F4CE840|nr:sugar transferase [Nesterenkonia sp. DZ6]MCH8559399.1 sugar transferase [Nesterenkonia sp. DZ6]